MIERLQRCSAITTDVSTCDLARVFRIVVITEVDSNSLVRLKELDDVVLAVVLLGFGVVLRSNSASSESEAAENENQIGE
jgi:hypothetical protein